MAQDLLGKNLVRIYRGKRISGIIVETEAYLGVKDPAAHTFGGRRTPRNEAMYSEGGQSYVYFIYGLHYCINVVTKLKNEPEAVLIRALECKEGLAEIKKWRKRVTLENLANGPGKICLALKIDKKLNGESFRGPHLFIEESGLDIKKRDIVKKPRIGVEYAGKASKWPLRFYIKGSKFISKK